jgi:twinkle protein
MKRYLRRLPCDKCNSSDGVQEIEEDEQIHFHCFVCGFHRNNVSSIEDNGNISITMNIDHLKSGPLKARGIPAHIAEMYGVKIEYDESNGEERKYYFPITKAGQVCGYQVRHLPKQFSSTGDVKGSDLFGQSICGDSGKLLIITEGMEDCLSAKHILLEKGKNYRVVSLPRGANSKSIKDNLEYLERFGTIILALDQDDPGKKVALEINELLSPGKCRIASFSEKDANDMLLKGKSEEFYYSILNAKIIKPDEIVSIQEIYDEAITPVQKGKDWPWPSLTRATYGRRTKEMYGFAAGTGAGKTEAFKEIIQHIIEQDKVPIGAFFLEEHPALTAKIIAGKIANKKFHVPDAGWTPRELQDGIKNLEGKVFLYNHFGQKSWDTLKSKIRYMVVSMGIKDIFIDHLTALVTSEEDDNKSLGRIMESMASMTQELDFTIYYISHLTRVKKGDPHEEGGRVTVDQLRGSGSIGFWSPFIFGFERDQQAEDEAVRNTVTVRVLKDRYTGEGTGKTFKLFYNHSNGRFLEEAPSEF